MPALSTPRSFAFLMSTPLGSVVPTVATGTLSPASKFWAPHTICSGSPPPTSTVVTHSFSASGCRSFVDDPPDDDALELRADRLDGLDGRARQVEPVGELGGRQVDRRRAPAATSSIRACFYSFFQNCRRNRTSDSRKTRRSGMSWRSAAMRSAPMPNAKPV